MTETTSKCRTAKQAGGPAGGAAGAAQETAGTAGSTARTAGRVGGQVAALPGRGAALVKLVTLRRFLRAAPVAAAAVPASSWDASPPANADPEPVTISRNAPGPPGRSGLPTPPAAPPPLDRRLTETGSPV